MTIYLAVESSHKSRAVRLDTLQTTLQQRGDVRRGLSDLLSLPLSHNEIEIATADSHSLHVGQL